MQSYPAQIESSSVPFYQKALSVVITDPSKMTAANLLKAQSSLGVSGATANDLHVAAFTEYLTGMIANAPDGIKFGPAESGALDSLQKTFGLDDADCKVCETPTAMVMALLGVGWGPGGGGGAWWWLLGVG